MRQAAVFPLVLYVDRSAVGADRIWLTVGAERGAVDAIFNINRFHPAFGILEGKKDSGLVSGNYELHLGH